MKNRIILLTGIVMVIFACNSNNTDRSVATKMDSLSASQNNLVTSIGKLDIKDPFPIPASFSKYHKLFKPLDKLPYVIDSIFFENYTKETPEPLNGEAIEILSKNFKSPEIMSSGEYSIKSFLFIDSLRQKKAYEAFLSKGELGQTINADAYPLHVFNLNGEIKVYTWFIKHSTESACPYGEGTEIFMTFVKDNKVLHSSQIAEESSGSDAPYWGTDEYYTTVNNKQEFKMLHISKSGGEEEDGKEKEESKTEKFLFKWENKSWKKIE